MTNTVIVNLTGKTQPNPIFSPDSNLNGLVFLNNTGELDFSTTGYGYAILNITYSGTAKFAGVSFSSNGSTFSISRTDLNGYFYDFPDGTLDEFYIALESGVTKSIYVILNGDTITSSLKILCSAGFSAGQPISSGIVTIVYDCPLVPLYKYTMGLHVYSSYDSVFTPKLTTNIYSNDNISGWTINTRVWMTSTLSMPALQYYYSSGNTVYKVGGPFKREYGVKFKYNLITNNWRSIWGKSPKVSKEQIGPASFYNLDDTIDACVNIITTDAGIITEVIDKNTLIQPSKYKYYMGFNSSNKQLSNDDFFAKYVFSQSAFYPITGLQHALHRLISGYIKSLKVQYSLDDVIPDPDGDFTGLIIAGITIATAAAVYLLKNALRKLIGKLTLRLASWNIFIGGNPGWAIAKRLITKVLSSAYVPWIGAAFAILGLAYNLFKKRRSTLQESCKQFLIEYTTIPYIELGSSLSRTQDMNNKNNGYYCDGAYFYTQSGDVITSKELSSTNALVDEDPLTLEFTNSILPDDPTHVTYLPSLFLLPYISGIPIEFGTGITYYSAAITTSVPLNDCAELILSNNPSFTLPYGYIISTVSQSDADNKAAAAAAAQSLIINGSDYSTLLNDENLGMLDSFFTHEIRVETTPMPVNIFYNNTDQTGLIIGKKAFFDEMGRYEVMNGYYAITGTTIFRTFYKFNNGYVVDIYEMLNSTSPTVTGNYDTISVININLEYTSNWYFTSLLQMNLTTKVNNILRSRCFDSNTLYSESYLVRGYYDSTNDNFLLYKNNTNDFAMVEASSGYYQPINEWLGDPIFQYTKSMIIDVDIEEICLPLTSYNNALYGFYVMGNIDGNLVPLYNNLNLTIDVYVNNNSSGDTLKATYNIITNSAVTKNYVSYNGLISINDNVSLIKIKTFNSPHTIGKISYLEGSFINCGTLLLTYVTTNNITYINSTTISTGGSIFNTKGVVEEYGVVFSTTINPTISNTYLIQGYNHDGDFNWESGLTYSFAPNTYYLKAVAKVNGIYYYGDQKTVNTINNKPIVNTFNSPIYDSGFTATVTGQIVSSGSSMIISSGVCWSYSNNPTINDHVNFTNYQSYPYFVTSLTGWNVNNIIYARAFAINAVGVGYGSIIHFMPNNYEIGSLAYGGIIAYIEYNTDPFVPHGLIARQYDLPGSYIWGCGFRTYASEMFYGYGRYNTEQIMMRCTQSNTAAKVCYDLVESGYTDWFLPSPGELAYLHSNLRENNIGNMSPTAAYWSSKEDHNAWMNWNEAYYKGGVMSGYSSKASTYKVRPCRYFKPEID